VANVHLDAVEHKDRIVFLHAVADGPASQSYGLQVAALAGVPATVIQLAKRHLAQLEQQGVPASAQGDLFAPRPVPESAPPQHPVVQRLLETDPDELSPKAALELVYQLRRITD
jgi:DNA mismatch repair protein MutS